jgi:UDP-glucose 4-epimerase
MNETVLVTGGAGFIGSNLTKKLVTLGYEVTVVDNFFLGKLENLKEVSEKIDFHEMDVRDKDKLKKLFEEKRFSYVFNEAACSSAPMFDKDPRYATDVNTRGFMNVLQLAKENKVKRVVYASTSSIYHDMKPPHGEDAVVFPKSFYTISKYFDELVARQYWDEHKLETIGLRYFSVYGPHELHKGRFANMVSQFFWLMKKDEIPVIYGDGEQSRDFIYVDDVVEANLLAMRNGIPGEIYNIGTGKRASFNEIVKILNKLLKKEIRPKYVQNPVHNYIAHTEASIEKAKKELKFVYKLSLEEGLKLLIE